MKFALNGALTIGTLDGANIEICEAVGQENIFIFGLKAPEVRAMREQRAYHPADYCDHDPAVRRVVDELASNRFCPNEPGLFAWVRQMLLDDNDEYFHVADLRPYIDAQEKAATSFVNRAAWTQMAILNVARVGKFSSDRTVREYARDIWHIEPVL
jgi:starch phosphorylase